MTQRMPRCIAVNLTGDSRNFVLLLALDEPDKMSGKTDRLNTLN